MGCLGWHGRPVLGSLLLLRITMNLWRRGSLPGIIAAQLFLFTACSNLSEKRTLLATAGFKTIPATTAAQIAQLKSLKEGKVVALTGKKGTFYVFPDPSKKSLMVGGAIQFQNYRKLKLKQRQIDEKLLDAQVNMDNADWNTWGPAASWGDGIASDPG